jgi:hypothetical protein
LRIPGLRRLAALVVSSVAVALASGILYFAAFAPLDGPPPARDTDRRWARPNERPVRVELAMKRLSRAHVGVRAHAVSLEGDSHVHRNRNVTVLLDTGLGLAITTPDGERLLDVTSGAGPSVVGHGLSGGESELLPIGDDQQLYVSIGPWGSPAHVATPVTHLGVDRLDGAHVMLPPELLGPRGGAVELDFGAERFAACENVAACRDGTGWVELANSPCAEFPDLVIVTAIIAGAPARLLLDTGGATLVSSAYFDAHGLGKGTVTTRESELIGSGGVTLRARVVQGIWPLALGEKGQVTRSAHLFWVPSAAGGAIRACHLDGSLGIDVLEGCAVTIEDSSPKRVSLRCP